MLSRSLVDFFFHMCFLVLNSLGHKPAKSCLDYEIPGLGYLTVCLTFKILELFNNSGFCLFKNWRQKLPQVKV